MSLFGSSGIRALIDKDLATLAFKVGLAVGQRYPDVVVGRDTRTSGDALKHAAVAGLLLAGARCADAGVLTTPTLAFATRDFAAGVMLTASHNPPQYNGIKLWNPDGSAFNAAQQREIEEAVLEDKAPVASWQKIKSGSSLERTTERHMQRILADFPQDFKLKVVLDCGCGAGSVITPYLLRKMGCEVLAIDCYPSGFFPHDIEPVEANLGNLIQAVKAFGADLGIAHDGDADRMMAVDDKGRFIPGDKLLALLARALGAKEIVTTIDASMVIDEMGLAVRRTRVGDAFVSEELVRGGGFGGEPSGAWIFPKVSLCPDGIYAAAQLVAIAAQQKLSGLVDAIPVYPLRRGSFAGDGVALSQLEAGLMALQPASVSKIDGLKLSFKDGWLLVRPSGTEPKIRLTAEAKTEARLNQLYDSAARIVKEK